MNLIQIYNFHRPGQRSNVHKCKHWKIDPNGLSPPPTARTYRLTRKSLSGAKNAFFIFHVSTANNSNFANEPRGKSRRMGCHHSPLPYPTLDLPTPPVGVFLSLCPDASTQVVPNTMTTSSQLRSGFG